MHNVFTIIRPALVATVALYTAQATAGIIIPPPRTLWVGADGSCDFVSIQAAIDDANTGDTIHIASNQPYNAQDLAILNKGLTMDGGWSDCDDDSPNATTAISGDGTKTILRIEASAGQTVVLRGLTFLEGGNQFPGGGALQIGGDVIVDLRNVRFFDNTSAEGGAIRVGGGAELRLTETVQIGSNTAGLGNSATNGAGIYCVSSTLQFGDVDFFGNSASAAGGAVYGNQCTIEMHPNATDWLVFNNDATHGGGFYLANDSFAVIGSSAGHFTSRVASNNAQLGGGFYLTDNATVVQLNGVHVSNNQSIVGAAAYADNGATFDMDRGSNTSMQCAEQMCSVIEGNQASGTGGVVYASDGAEADIQATFVIDNITTSGSMFDLSGNGTELYMASSVLAGNQSDAGFAVFATDFAEIDLRHLTMAGSTGNMGVIGVDSDATLSLRNSIIVEDGTTVVESNAGSLNFQCNNANLGNNIGASSHDPGFIDFQSGDPMDLQLSHESLNRDTCELADGAFLDILGNPRLVVLDGLADAYDRGAFEWQDLLFADTFGE